jgi:hypothetical protein
MALANELDHIEALILAVPHEQPLKNSIPKQIVKRAGAPLAVIDCFGIPSDEKIRRYIELGCEVKALGRGHIQRIKETVRAKAKSAKMSPSCPHRSSSSPRPGQRPRRREPQGLRPVDCCTTKP